MLLIDSLQPLVGIAAELVKIARHRPINGDIGLPEGEHAHDQFQAVNAGNILLAQALVPSQGRVAHDSDAGSPDSLQSKARYTKSRGDNTTI